ncbi:hypothetical protein QUG64_03255 [Acinetobacter lwoffii]|uniref:Helix-turn-helix type 11 domain-containing protein n=1 Tax=Acinetobacter lwoffii NCTC 5866 = CIP 64.10 = NIPH 512 TaxID=981327 RepID=A0ABP2ZJF0_ACILW|nr:MULTISPECIES: hypothetical protein [Acinetobacter]ENU16674.1 hypothetical protein F995_02159 [Acinetobacter sp. CIP A162]ESJ96029.1 hypothetical protein P800_00851 [Acinetobacter lwoffii NCTC 5866 = CIP 64.10 = NIPH 512]QXB40456.1 hypothetical protein I6L23_14995 [Acinetobacter lwoffii]SUU30323.1 Uncharacterised protein [Acinetobacter lwoffii]VFQ38447.1 Uncharacterised protein [Acinetobacter lwoffii]
MTNIKDLNSLKMDKNLGKVVDTLANDPFGLSAAQIANNSKMSLKTVKNCLAVLLQEEKIHLDELGVYHTTQTTDQVHAEPVVQKENLLVVSAKTGAVQEVVKDQTKINDPTPPAPQVVGVEGFDAKITPTNLLNIIPGTPFKIEQPLPETPQDESKPIRARIIECIKSASHGAKPATVATALGLTARQVRNSCYSLENLGCLRSENSGDERTFFYVKDIPRVRAEPRMSKVSTSKKEKNAKSPFDNWVEHRVVETKTVKLTENQLEQVLKHVFKMDNVTFLTPLPDPYVVELKMEVVR